MAYKSPLRAWPPVGKLLLVLALLMGSLLSPTPAVPLIVLIIGIVLLNHSCSLKLPNIMALACMETMLMLAISVTIIALMMPGEMIWQMNIGNIQLHISRQAANLALLLLARASAGFVVLLFFASSTPIPHLFLAMRQMGLPAFLAELVVLVYRYSFMLLEQMQQMAEAADCRLGFRNLKQSMHTTGKLVAGLFGRSMDFADRAQAALMCRNFRGQFMPFREPAKLTAKWVVASVAILAVLVLVGQIGSHWLVL